MAGTQPALVQVTLGSLASLLGRGVRVSSGETVIHGLCSDSRQVLLGDLFFAVPGHHADGTRFIRDALMGGAVGVVSDRPIELEVPTLVVPDVRIAKARIAQQFYAAPTRDLRCVGVTGTNGKTTTCAILTNILEAAGLLPTQIGTLGAILAGGAEHHRVVNTTPDPILLARWLRRAVDKGSRAAVLEVSSHALHQHRVAEMRFEIGVFTQVSREHLDYHHSMQEYREAKAELFRMLPEDGVAVLNAEHADWQAMADRTAARIVTYGLCPGADVRATGIERSAAGIRFQLERSGRSLPVFLPLLGRHNLMNALAAVAAALPFEVAIEAVAGALEKIPQVAGRLESIDAGQPFTVLVDYAHTDDALEKVLAEVRRFARGRILTVFGCGGERDAAKRPRMGRVASVLSDLVIVTSDNPRREDPEAIARDILVGVQGSRVRVELDRRAAIELAVAEAREGDLVLIAGKGHEADQIVGERRLPFDDRAVAKEALWRL